MLTINQLREKYWADPKSLCPETASHEQLAVRYNREEYAVDHKHMNEARRNAQRAVIFNWLSQEQKAERAFNEANSWLAGAMQVDGKNVEFWGQDFK